MDLRDARKERLADLTREAEEELPKANYRQYENQSQASPEAIAKLQADARPSLRAICQSDSGLPAEPVCLSA